MVNPNSLRRNGGMRPGYAGVAWSMLGKFDRTWFDRPIFGKIRYMSAGSTGKKFASELYIQQVRALAE